MKKRILVLLLTLFLVLAMAPAVFAAATEGTAGPNITWTYDADTKTLTFTGTGEMTSGDTRYSPVKWASYKKEATTVVVGEGITSLRNYCFDGFSVLTDVTLPSTLKSMGEEAFSGCHALESLVLPEGLEEIPFRCFMYSSGLKEISIPSTVTFIDAYAFQQTSLTSVTIPGSVVEIKNSAFQGCEGLAELTICEGVTAIGNRCFSGTALTEVVLPDSLTTMYYEAFADCRSLRKITIGSGLTGIPMRAFQNAAIESIDIPDNITGIASSAFASCKSLTTISLPQTLRALGDYAFNGCTALESIELPPSLEEFGNGVFAGSGLRSVTLPGGCIRVGDNAFAGCEQLTEVNLHDSVRYMGVNVFSGCTALTTLQLPRSLDYINTGTFMESGITELEIPYGVTDIHSLAFYDCKTIGKLLIPPTVTYIGYDAFYGCENLNIHCYADTYAHKYAVSNNIPYTIVEGDGSEPVYQVGLSQTPGGTVTMVSESHPYRYVDIEATPAPGSRVDQIVIAYDSEDPYLDLYLRDDGDGTWSFLMPECDVHVFVYFFSETMPFTDVPEDSFYYDSVLWAVNYGITSGTTPTTFGPGEACNRAQVVTFLWRAAGSPEPETAAHPFTDVEAGSFYEKAVLWAMENGITTGVSATEFGPNEPCNRAQVVTFLWRASGAGGPEMMTNPFTDVPMDIWYTEAVLWAVENGITTGLTADTFGPDEVCNRAQVVTFLYRAFA